MKRMKKYLSLFLIILLAAGLCPADAWTRKAKAAVALENPRIVPDGSLRSGQKVTWDCIWFGSYPQSEVKSTDDVYLVLENDSIWDGKDDIEVKGAKYRRIKTNRYYDTSWHYFKYEPIKWRVLNVSGGRAFLRADVGLDHQKYNEAYIPITWEMSTIRSWLNGYEARRNKEGIDYSSQNFIDSAFSTAQKNAIINTDVINKNNKECGTEGGNGTIDKIFLLSESEVYGTDEAASYGFAKDYDLSDDARKIRASDYADTIAGYPRGWWLRSPGSEPRNAMFVKTTGDVSQKGYEVIDTKSYIGRVCPALNLSLSSSDLYSYAGTVCSDGTVNMEGAGGSGTDTKISIKDAEVILPQQSYVYDGKEKQPEVTVRLNGAVLTPGADYTVSYSNNVNTGTAVVTVTGKGNYKGTAKKNFTITGQPSQDNGGNSAGQPSQGDDKDDTAKPPKDPGDNNKAPVPQKGAKLTDAKTKASYLVTQKGATAAYAGTSNKKAVSVTIPTKVTIGGIAYKVTSIAAGAFKNNKKLKKAAISGNVTSIGANAFSGCSALTSVKLGNKVTAIGSKAFFGCKKLSSLTIGKNTISIGKSTFENCTAIKKVVIPAKIKKIGSKSFYNCKKLTSITIQSKNLTAKNVGSKAFAKAGGSNYKKLTIKVPKNKHAAYKKLLLKKGVSKKAKIK